MSDVTDALDEMKTLLLNVDPSPSPSPLSTDIWVYPGDQSLINFNDFPFIIISKFIFDTNQIQSRGIGGNRYMHKWKMQIDVMLTKGGLTDNNIQAEAEQLQDEWYVAIANEIMQNLSLTDTVDQVGPVIDYVDGNIPWRDRFTGWGIRFVVPVTTTLCAS